MCEQVKIPDNLQYELEGKFLLIKDKELIDHYCTYEDAIKAGYQKFGLESFLVNRYHTVNWPQIVTRLLTLQEKK